MSAQTNSYMMEIFGTERNPIVYLAYRAHKCSDKILLLETEKVSYSHIRLDPFQLNCQEYLSYNRNK